MLYLIVGLVVGIFIGILIAVVCRPKCYGTITIRSDKIDGSYLFLDLDRSIEDIMNSEKVYFKVDSRCKHIV